MATRTGIDDEITFYSARDAPPFTPVHDWVMLSGISPQAICLYAVMCMYYERDVSLDMQAVLETMGVDDRAELDPWLAELADIDAATVGLKSGKNVYTLHALPPPGYAGRQSLVVPVEWRPRWRGKPGPVVYYLQREDGYIKIGHSGDLQKRIVTLEAEHGDLKVLGYEPGGWDLEQQRHHEHREWRAGKTEWFAPTVQLLSHIEALTVVGGDN